MGRITAEVRRNLSTIIRLESCILQNEYDTATIYSVYAGDIILQTGKVTIADPRTPGSIEDLPRKTFADQVTPGTYPVFVYIAKAQDADRVGFAEIRFSDEMPVKFVPAKTIFDVENNHKGSFGYPVGYSRTGYMDAAVYQRGCETHLGSAYGILDYDNEIGLLKESPELALYAFCSNKDMSMNAIHFRVSNGRYYWYWGITADNHKCCLIGDFFTYL